MAKKKKLETELEETGTSPTVSSSLSSDQKQDKYRYVIRNKRARRETKTKRIVIIIIIILLILLLVGGAVYGFLSAVRVNNYTIQLTDSVTGTLSLSQEKDVNAGATSVLEVVGPELMDNTSLSKTHNLSTNSSIETVLEDIMNNDGQYTTSKDCYIATTFYLTNTSSDAKIYSEYLELIEATNGIENALRVMLIEDDLITIYGAAKSVSTTDENGNPVTVKENEEVVPKINYPTLSIQTDEDGTRHIVKDTSNVWLCEDFYGQDEDSKRYLIYNKNINLPSNTTKKYSLIIWLEGNDPDCVNKIINGKIRIQFSFTGSVDLSN
ncbi:MAG: hypothetical protein K5765_07075 [Clostridia bacterium]|nr:hypothetical protein [Clostridia bacterium]